MGLFAPGHGGSSWIRNQTVSPALAGGFFTIEPRGKPPTPFLTSPPEGAFVIIDEPTVLHHYHSKFTVYIRVHSWGHIFYRFWHVSTTVVSYRIVSLSWKFSVLCLFIPFFLLNPGNHWSFFLSLCVSVLVACHPVDCNLEFSRREYWSWLPFSSPGNLPNPWSEPPSRALQADSLLSL